MRYAATPLGPSVLEPIAALAECAHANAESVAAAQDQAGYPVVPERPGAYASREANLGQG